jgi:hypothetical protein
MDLGEKSATRRHRGEDAVLMLEEVADPIPSCRASLDRGDQGDDGAVSDRVGRADRLVVPV